MTRPSRTHTVNVIGGLGNQLFQYLFGETLAGRTGAPTIYDLSAFRGYRLHTGYAIESVLGVTLPVIDEDGARRALATRYPSLQKVVRKSPLAAAVLGCETDRTFSIDEIRPDAGPLFVGYWQSQPYTPADIARVAGRLSFDPAVQAAVDGALSGLGPRDELCAIHVRRGDFVTAPPSAPHYALDAGYFRSAIATMTHQGVKRFIAVSDDPSWVASELAPHAPLCQLSGPGLGSVAADLCLLASLPNRILSNSTFAWWGAHLGPAGRVIAPRRWCRPIPLARLWTPIMPSGWSLIDGPAP